MAPSAATSSEIDAIVERLATIKPIGRGNYREEYKGGSGDSWIDHLPASTRQRFEKHGIDLSRGYPVRPPIEKIPKFIDEAYAVRDHDYPFIERGKNADPEKKALFGAAKEVKHLSKFVGTELVGIQLNDLTDQQKDELALLVAERIVVFFRDQDLAPQKQLELGKYWGQLEIHPQAPRVPLGEGGLTVIWPDYNKRSGLPMTFRNSRVGNSIFHSDDVHEKNPAGITHLYLDAIPDIGGDTVWASSYGAYDKLSPAFQKFLDGKTAIFRSAHQYADRENPLRGAKYIEREHPIVRTHPATGWKALFVNRSMTVRIVGLEPDESKLILEYLFDVYEKNLDIQVRFNWRPTKPGFGTAAIWDNRVSQHSAVPFLDSDYDYELRGKGKKDERHGTRSISLAEVPFFDPNSKSQREALGL